MRGSKSLIENPDFSSGTYRTRAIIVCGIANIPPSSPALWERKGAEGKVRGPGVLRSIGAEPDATCFYRAKATYAFPTNVSLWSLSKARIVDEALRYSPLQPTTLLSA